MIGDMEIVDVSAYWNHVADDPDVMAKESVVDWFEPEVLNEANGGRVPGRDLGWLLAQGWMVTKVDEPAAGVNPPEKLYSLERSVLKQDEVLEKLIHSYVDAYNEGREANDKRYDDIVTMWHDTILKGHSHLNRAADAHNAYDVLYINNLDSIASQIDTLLDETRSDASATFDEAAASLNTFAAKLDELGTGHDEYVTEIETILTKQQADLATFEGRTTALLTQLTTDYTAQDAAITALETTEDSQAVTHIAAYEAKLAELESTVTTAETALLVLVDDAETNFLAYQTEATTIISTISGELTSLNSDINGLLDDLDTAVDSHGTTHAGLVALFLSDFTTHATITRALLTGLGVTELARINEAFDNLLAAGLQKLTDRGLYSSALVTQVTARVERERTEAIGSLNDRLAREKVGHEHQLYGEQSTVRDKQQRGEEYQFKLTDIAIQFRAEWGERLYNHAVAANQMYLAIRQSLLAAENQFISQEASVRETIVGWRLKTKQIVADGKDRVFGIRDAINRWKGDNEFKLVAALRAVRAVSMDIYTKDLTLSLDVEQFAAKARESIVRQLNDYIRSHADGLAKYASMTVANGQFLAGVRDRAVVNAMRTRFAYTDGLANVQRTQQKLYSYQLDTRNNLCTGLFKLMERRSDTYPSLDKMGQIVLGLGDAGATQVVQE